MVYVVTEDVEVLLGRWAARHGFTLPSPRFFTQLSAGLAKILLEYFPAVWVESYEDFKRRITQHLNCGLCIVSIDEVYVDNAHKTLQITRLIDDELNDLGRGSRLPAMNLEEQVYRIADEFRDRPIAIVDDGCWSSGTISETVQQLRESGLNVQRVFVGLSSPAARENFLHRFDGAISFKSNWEVEGLIDWVCQRDFFPGVPLSGKQIGTKKMLPIIPETGAPYVLPFGDPVHWASIPKENEKQFSARVIDLTIKLWEEIEATSKHPVTIADLDRIPRGLQKHEGRLVHHLKLAQKRLG